jgi:Fic family protein
MAPSFGGGGDISRTVIITTMDTHNTHQPAVSNVTPPSRHLELQERLRERLRVINENSDMQNQTIDLLKIFPHTENHKEQLAQIDELKKCLDSFRPLTPSESVQLAEAFDLEYTYESNRIEGNSLTLVETQVVLEHGVTVGGKPLIHHLEAVNHRDALIFVKNLVQEKAKFTPSILLDINRIILKGSVHEEESGRFRQKRVMITGSRHVPPNYVVVPDKMEELYHNLEQWQTQGMHPVEIAANLHFEIVKIHPFVDGNGRTARLVMSFWLLQNGYTIANLSGADADKLRYYTALEKASVQGNIDPFKTLIYEREKASLIWHLEGLTPDVTNGRGAYYLETISSLL